MTGYGSITLWAAVLLAGCSFTRAEFVTPLGPDPAVAGGTYTTGGGLSVAAELRESERLTVVCGVWAINQQSAMTKLAEQQVLNSGALFRGRERVVSGLLFMRRVDPAPSYGGQEANCFRTDRPWRGPGRVARPEIFLPRQIIPSDADYLFGNRLIWFRPGGPGAGDGNAPG